MGYWESIYVVFMFKIHSNDTSTPTNSAILGAKSKGETLGQTEASQRDVCFPRPRLCHIHRRTDTSHGPLSSSFTDSPDRPLPQKLIIYEAGQAEQQDHL